MAIKGSATITLTQYRDTQSVTRYYKLQPAGSSTPLKPETKPPSSDWTDSEPACDISKELYFCDLTIFSNGEWEYSTVSKSTSYEAAKQAYNKADNAQTSIDNLEIGGRNLFIETDYENIRTQGSASTRGWWLVSNIKNSIVDDNSEKAAKINGNLWSIGQFVNVEAGETYTMSCFARLETERSAAKLRFQPDLLKPSYVYFDKDLTTDYQKLTCTWTCEVGGMERIHILTANQTDVLYVKKIKFEKGNKATDWTPAPEDVDNNIKDSINNLDIVSINLLLNSGFKNTADEWFTYGITDYIVKDGKQCAHMNFSVFKVTNFVRQSILGKLEPDTQYTMSAWVLTENVVKGSTNFACMFYHDGYYDNNGSRKWYSYGSKDLPINAGEWTHLEWTFTTDSTKLSSSTVSDMYLYARDMTGDIYFCDLKLEKGDKATDWTPAPDDVANAAKVATNFINYDSTNGLIIGNKTSGSWSGYRSQILPGSFNVLDASSTVLASFGPTTVIGEEANANIHLTFNNLSMIDRDGTKFFEVGDNRNAEGIATVKHTAIVSVGSSGSATVTVNSNISSIVSVYADSVQLSSSSYSFSQKDVTINGLTADSEKTIEITYTTTESTVYLTFGERDSSANIGNYSAAEGYNVISSGYCSHAEGEATTASGLNSHAEGYRTTASGYCSHAEGCRTIASGPYSHAEGNKTIAKGLYSHAEGEWTEAIDSNSHAEGYNTTAKGHCSHAEGAHTVASGMHSHAAGYMTVADSNYMTAIGQYNTRNSGKAFVIGNGEDDKHRSDAFTVSWAGSVGIAYNIFMELGDCYVRDNTFDKTLSVIDGASTLDGLVAQSIINTFSYADAIEILGEEITGRNANINVKKLLQKIVEKIGKR